MRKKKIPKWLEISNQNPKLQTPANLHSFISFSFFFKTKERDVRVRERPKPPQVAPLYPERYGSWEGEDVAPPMRE